MKTYNKLLVILLVWQSFAFAQTTAKEITPDAVIEIDRYEFEIVNDNKAYWRHYRKVAVNKDAGKSFGVPVVYENKFIRKKRIDAEIVDVSGNRLKKYGKDDIRWQDYSPGYALYSDVRYHWIEATWAELPYVVEYETEVEMNSLFFWPDWYPQSTVPVLSSSYRLILPTPDFPYKTYQANMAVEPTSVTFNTQTSIRWEATLLPAIKPEDRMPSDNSLYQALYFSPVQFRLEDYPGSMEDWQGFARWYENLTNGLYALSAESQDHIRYLVQPEDDVQTKIGKLYAHLQNMSRYVNISLGIGGWQPHPAQDVFDNKYGDCKDLSTLMIAMLDAVDIPAYPALTPTRDEISLLAAFPSNQFNHCIAMVPLPEDTVWLECTADYITAGELPHSVEGAKVLVVNPDGGEIVPIPESRPQANVMTSRFEGKLLGNGTLQLKGWYAVTGNQAIFTRNTLAGKDRQSQHNWIRSRILNNNASRFNLTDFTIENLTENFSSPCRIDFSGEMIHFGKRGGSRLFINLNMLNGYSDSKIPKETPEERKYPVDLGYAFMDVDTVIVELPFGYQLDSAPPPDSLDSEFGYYRTAYTLNGSVLQYIRVYQQKIRQVPLQQYADYQAFIREVVRRDKTSFVFKR